MSEPTYYLTLAAVVWARDGDETLALDLGSGSYVGVNSSGTLLWHALERGATRAQLAEQLSAAYGLDSDRAHADAEAFLRACRLRGYLAD